MPRARVWPMSQYARAAMTMPFAASVMHKPKNTKKNGPRNGLGSSEPCLG